MLTNAIETLSIVVERNVVVTVTLTFFSGLRFNHINERSQDDIALCPHSIFSISSPSFYVGHTIDGVQVK